MQTLGPSKTGVGKIPRVLKSLETLSNKTADLEDSIATLNRRLERITENVPENPNIEKGLEVPQSISLASGINSLTDRLVSVREKVDSIISRLEI